MINVMVVTRVIASTIANMKIADTNRYNRVSKYSVVFQYLTNNVKNTIIANAKIHRKPNSSAER